MAAPGSAAPTPIPNLSALSGKIKLVLSSFPQWDLKTTEEVRPRADSDFEDQEKKFVLGKEEQCQPTLIISQQELSSDESGSEESSSSSQADDPLSITPKSAPQPPAHSSERGNNTEEQLDPLSVLALNKHKQPPPPPAGVVTTRQAKKERKMEAENASNPDSVSPPAPKKLYPDDLPKPIFHSAKIPVLETAVSSKAPILVTRSEDASIARRTIAREASKNPVPEHKSSKACQGCLLW